jgi:hypothetical protein
VAALAIALASGCLYDSSDRCGKDMRYDEARMVCVCADNAVPITGGCRACAEDEVAAGGKCVCPDGEAKNADNVCVSWPLTGCPMGP